MKTRKRVLALLLALLCLAGCGGGGGAKSLTKTVRPAPVEAGLDGEDAAALAGFSMERTSWCPPCRSSAP